MVQNCEPDLTLIHGSSESMGFLKVIECVPYVNQLYGRNYESDFEFLMARHVTKTLYKYSLTPRTTP